MLDFLTGSEVAQMEKGRGGLTFWVEIMTLDRRGHEFDFLPPEQINCEKRLTIKLRESAAAAASDDLESHDVFGLRLVLLFRDDGDYKFKREHRPILVLMLSILTVIIKLRLVHVSRTQMDSGPKLLPANEMTRIRRDALAERMERSIRAHNSSNFPPSFSSRHSLACTIIRREENSPCALHAGGRPSE